MATKFIWNGAKDKKPTFGDLRDGEFFMYEDELYIKVETVYNKDELDYEVDYVHNLVDVSEINTTADNCYCLNNPCFRFMGEDTEITKVDVEISITPKGGEN